MHILKTLIKGYYYSMISYLKGAILYKTLDYIILLTNGIGYKVSLPENLNKQLREGQDGVEVHCSLMIRNEETLELYGFASPESLGMFTMLNTVSGIGPKAALAICSLGNPEDIKKAIMERNTNFFRGIKGLGEKKIQTILLSLTGRVGEFDKNRGGSGDEALDALVALGFPRGQVKEVLDRIDSSISDSEKRIKEALKLLGGRK